MSTRATPEAASIVPTFAPQILLYASFALALVVVLAALLARRKKSSRGNIVLLTGVSESGKTSIFSSLVFGQTFPTHVSLQTNSGVYAVGDRALVLVDSPGHPRIRDQYKEHVPNSKTVIFVIDASTVVRNGAAVAEHLHHVLNTIISLPPSQTPPALLILSHKTDLLTTGATGSSQADVGLNRVRTVLERELERRRTAHTGGVGIEGLGEEGTGADMTGALDCSSKAGTFHFDDWEGGDIHFLATTVKSQEKDGLDGLAEVRQWLEDLN